MATVSVTFDNLGEAAELERGEWPEEQPVGEHFSVRECLPEVLGMLAAEGLAATFFYVPGFGELRSGECEPAMVRRRSATRCWPSSTRRREPAAT